MELMSFSRDQYIPNCGTLPLVVIVFDGRSYSQYRVTKESVHDDTLTGEWFSMATSKKVDIIEATKLTKIYHTQIKNRVEKRWARPSL